MVSVHMFKKHFQELGFSEPVLVMKKELNSSLFEQKEQRFLLIPIAQAIILVGHIDPFQTRFAILIGPSLAVSQISVRTWFDKLHFALGVSWDEIVTQHQLIPGKLLQIWCSLKDGIGIAFGFLQVDEDNVAPQKPLKRKRKLVFDLNSPSPAEIPEKFKNRIQQLGFSNPVMVMQKELNLSLFDEQQRYFMIPNEEADLSGFLMTNSNQFLYEYLGFPLSVTLIGPSLSETKVYVEKSNVDTTYKLKIGWKEFVRDHKLIAGDKFQLWCFKNMNSEVGFALVDFDKSNVQVERLKKAPEIPEEIKDRITGFRGSGIVFVIEKTLQKLDVQSSKTSRVRFSIPLDKLKSQFLSDEEKHNFVKLYHDEGIDAFFIGPSIDHDDAKEFNIKMMKRGSYYFRGAGWMDFVEKYGLEEGKKVLVWSFRRPCASTDSQIGTGPSEIGFALVVVNEKQV